MKKINLWVAFISIMMLSNFKANAQVDVANHTYNSAYYVGWNSANDLNFKLGSTPTTYMTLLSSGDLNVVVGTNGYKIATNYVLRNNNNTADIFVGVDAGNGTMTGHSNTYVGHVAAKSTTSGYKNVAVGDSAGYGITSGWYDTYVGYSAGKNTGNGDSNTGIGYQALKTTTAYDGTAVGYNAAVSNTTGCALTAVGGNALYGNTTGTNNCAFGYNSLNANTTLAENVAIGAYALAAQSYNGGVNSYNVAVGNGALGFNNPNSTTNGIQNSALGHQAGSNNVTGSQNSIFGYQAGYGVLNNSYSGNNYFGFQAGYSTTTGISNVCIGVQAGYSNTANYQTFMGYNSGYANTTGGYNTFLGYLAGSTNILGSYNTFIGLDAGKVSTASSNSAVGHYALVQTTSGGSNTGLGYRAGYANTTGANNTFVGNQADANAGTYTNCSAYGNGASTTASNKYVFGNTSVAVIGGQVGWSTLSDGRFKINVKENVSGLDFINKLRPVTYNMDTKTLDTFLNQNRQKSTDSSGNVIDSTPRDFTESTNIVHSGFIAQEVEDASQATGYTSSIVNAPSNSNDPYSLNYAEIVVPLVKAVQQLDSTNKALQSQLSALQTKVSGGLLRRASTQDNSSDQTKVQPIAIEVTLSSKSIVLDQNQPNPFKEQTIITYFIPDDAKNVKIIFTDSRGNIMKDVSITEKGNGQLNVYAQDLSSGIYTYNIVVDGVSIDSKKMVCTK